MITTTFKVCSAPDGQASVALAPVHLALGHRIPAEVELPVEAAVGHVAAGVILERLVADHVDDRTHHRRPTTPATGISLTRSQIR